MATCTLSKELTYRIIYLYRLFIAFHHITGPSIIYIYKWTKERVIHINQESKNKIIDPFHFWVQSQAKQSGWIVSVAGLSLVYQVSRPGFSWPGIEFYTLDNGFAYSNTYSGKASKWWLTCRHCFAATQTNVEGVESKFFQPTARSSNDI